VFYYSWNISLALIRKQFPCIIISTSFRNVTINAITPGPYLRLSFRNTQCGHEIADNVDLLKPAGLLMYQQV
jgi:hypothetical protein